jgi:CzcA family heavy metal efflux pump
MRRLLQSAVSNPVAILLLLLIAGIGGMYALLHLPVSLFPALDVPVVNVICHYPGAGAEDTEQLITRPIEGRIRSIAGVQRVSSQTIAGVSQVTAEFEWGTSLANARQSVQAELSNLQTDLPPEVVPHIENIGTTLQEVAGYSVSGGANLGDLRSIIQNDIAGRLMEVEGVSRVSVLGGDEPAFIVNLRPDALARLHLTIADITAALAKNNLVASADFIERGSKEYFIRGQSKLQTIDDVRMVPVLTGGRRTVLLQDVASVRAGRMPRHYEIHSDGAEAVAFFISKQPQANAIDIVRGVDRKLDELKPLLPPGARISKFYDQSDIILLARNSLVHDLIVGAVLAAAVLFFFMGTARATLITAASIPLTLLATLALMLAFGQTFNVITLAALTLAVGMVVDDAIVVADSIIRHFQKGKQKEAAAVDGAAEIAGPDISGTLTTVAAFAPLLLIGGLAGLFIRPFGLVISLALLASLLISLTFVPTMFGWIGTSAEIGGGRMLRRVDGSLQRVLDFSFHHRRTILAGWLAALGLTFLAALLGPLKVLPSIDEGAMLIEYVMPPGTSLAESNRVGNILEQIALGQPDVVTVYRRTGTPESAVQLEAVNRGELLIKLTPLPTRKRSLDQLMEKLRQQYSQIPGVAFLYHQPTQEKMDESLSGLPALFGVTVFGADLNELISVASRVEEIMHKDPSIKSIVNNTKFTSPQIIVRPDYLELARVGLAPEEVFEDIKAARFGVLATTIVNERRQQQVLVSMSEPGEATLQWLESLPILTRSGKTVPLNRIADVRVEYVPGVITHLNGQREVTVMAEVDGSIPQAVHRLQREFEPLDLPNGYSIAFTGQYETIMRTARDFALIGLAALLLIYLIMSLQFKSWVEPLLILFMAPIALVGAIVALAISRVGLDISVDMGILTLIGIAVNNAIVLVDYANREAASGKAMKEALRSAASIRLRPILMTATTTIFALLPVAINPAVGSRIFQPFAITLIGGLLSATAATLILLPLLVSLTRRDS